MSNILSSNCIITFDKQIEKTCILSTSNTDKIIFPTFRVLSAKNLDKETKYNIKGLFIDSNIRLLEDVIISTIDIQNELYIDYLKELGLEDYNEDNDIIILNSIILGDKYNTNLFWRTYDHMIDIQNKDVFGLLIDYILQRTTL